jgi:hypothetical protein
VRWYWPAIIFGILTLISLARWMWPTRKVLEAEA